MKAQTVVNTHAAEVTFKRRREMCKVRREYLKSQQEQKYCEVIGQFINQNKAIMQELMNVFIQVTGTDVNAFNKSG